MKEPLAYTIEQACDVSGNGRTAIYNDIKIGKLRAVKNGRRTLILADDLRAWLASFPAVEHTE
jgi:excisionase family DNA binding protein